MLKQKMTGYSGKPLVQKLGIKPGFRIFVDGASLPYGDIVGGLPADVKIVGRLRAPLDLVHIFAVDASALRKKLPACGETVAPDGMVWVSWPKKSSGVATDVTETAVRETGLPSGLVDIKVCAIDDIWSGLKFVIPKDRRQKRSR